LYRVYEIWNQICASLIDVLHLCPTLIDSLLQADEAIVAAPQREDRNNHDEEQDGDYRTATDGEFAHR
jgi:hypothetical protein